MNTENYLIHTTKDGVNIFFMSYLDSSGGYFHMGDNKPLALAEVKDANGKYLDEQLKGLVWCKMLASTEKDFNRKSCMQGLERQLSRNFSEFNKAMLDYLKGLN